MAMATLALHGQSSRILGWLAKENIVQQIETIASRHTLANRETQHRQEIWKMLVDASLASEATV
jgi:hypothetical protein